MTAAPYWRTINQAGARVLVTASDIPDCEAACRACGTTRAPLIPDRGRVYCEPCMFADLDREAAEHLAETPVTVRGR